MSAPAQDSLPLFCELGWHRPEKLARWNDGYYFSKCTRCGLDLVRTAYGHWQVPRGFRVVWQPGPPESRPDIDLVPAESGEGPAGAENGSAAPSPAHGAAEAETIFPPPPEPSVAAAEAGTAALAPSGQLEDSVTPEAPAAAKAELADPIVTRAEGSVVTDLAGTAETVPDLESTPAALPMGALLSQGLSSAHDGPLNGSAAPATPEPAGLQIGEVREVPAAAAAPDGADAPAVEQKPAEPQAAAAEEEGDAKDQLAFPGMPSAEAATAERQELPILEVIRHLKATAPEVLPDLGQAGSHSETDLEIEVERVAEAAAPALSEAGAETEALEQDAPAQASSEPVSADTSPETGEAAAAEPAVADPEPAPAPAEVAPPQPRPEPVRHYSDFDFMAEEEEDPIGTFWEETASEPSSPAPRRSASEPSQQTGAEAQHGPAAVPSEEPGPAPSSTAWEQPAADSGAARRPERLEAVQASGEASQPTGGLPAPDAPREETPSVFRPVAAAAPPVPTTVAVSTAAAAPAAETAPMADLEDWLQRSEQRHGVPAAASASNPGDQQTDAAPAPRVALAALVSIGIVALVIGLSARSNVGSNLSMPAGAEGEQAGVDLVPDTGAATSEPDPALDAPLPPLAPILPARETAFVTASVLQCRSAPVESSEPVRKLVRGAEVQILAREGEWSSVAHKGRQCWVATRFLSALQPW